jgi:hypothetical protein
MKKILTRKDYLTSLNTNYYSKFTGVRPLYEEAPFANDTPWGDTLIGRLINSVIRKGTISFNKRRISGLVSRLKSIFDEMLELGTIDISKSDSDFLKISNALGILKKQVEDEEDVAVLISTTEDLLMYVEMSENFENQSEMIKALEEFLEYLQGLKKGGDSDSDEKEKNEEDTEESDPNVIFLKNSKLLLQSLLDLHSMIKQDVVRIGGGQESYDNKVSSAKSKLKVGNEYMYTNSKGEKIRCMLLSLTNEIQRAADKKWLTPDDIKGKKLLDDNVCVVYKRDKDGNEVKDYNLVYNSQIVEILKISTIGGKEPDKVQKPGENISTSFNKEKYLNLEKTYQTGKNFETLKNLIKMSQNAIKIYQAKKDQQSIKYYTDKLNQQVSILVKIQAKSYGINLELTKEVKIGDKKVQKPTGQYKDTQLLKNEIRDVSGQPWSIDLKLGGKSNKDVVGQPKQAAKPITMKKDNFDYFTEFDIISEEVEANLQGAETQARNAWNKVVNAFNKSGINQFIPQIESLLKISIKDGKDEVKRAKSTIMLIGKQVILNKSTVGKPILFDDLVKEAISINDVSKSISLVARILIAFKEDMGLTGSYGSAIRPLKDFINSFNELEKNISKISTDKKESLNRYIDFVMILERNEFSDDIKVKFNEIFTEEITKYFELTDDKKSELESKTKERQEMLFTDADPIIEIVRLFNRAWRIHTPGVIPSGRTGGRVSNSVFREYEYMGSGSPGSAADPGGGPYRNIELYEKWFEAVQDILSDTKYRPIFSENTVLRFTNEETGQEGDEIQKGGKILLKFMNELLSENKMYKEGAMSKFIKEYFNLDDKQTTQATKELVSGDNKNNAKVVSEIKNTEVIYKKLDQVKELDKFQNDLYKLFISAEFEEYERLTFKINVEKDDKKSTYYGVFMTLENTYPLILISTKNYCYDLAMVSGSAISKTAFADKVFLSSLPKTGGMFKVGSNCKIKMIEVSKDPMTQGDLYNIEFKINTIEILCEKDTGNPYTEFKNYNPKLKASIERNMKTAKSYVKS